MAKRGRPPVLDERKRGEILGVLAIGGSVALAARTVGCCPRTIYNTATRDPEFGERMQRARANHELKLLKRLEEASQDPKYWRAAAWQLERMYPDRYQPRMANSLPIAEVERFVHELLDLVTAASPSPETRSQLAAQARENFDRFTAEHDGNVEAALKLTAVKREMAASAA
jgi:hypothetical protein